MTFAIISVKSRSEASKSPESEKSEISRTLSDSETAGSAKRLGERKRPVYTRSRRAFDTHEKEVLEDSLKPFDHEELRKMMEEGTKDYWKMLSLIGRAAIERDERFLDLLERDDLKVLQTPKEEMTSDQRGLRIAIQAYRYMMTKDETLLDELISDDGKMGEAQIMILGYIDEWERTIPAIKKVKVDGALWYTMSGFWLRREYFQPQKFAERDWRKR